MKNSAVATGLEKVSFHSNPKERQCKECSNYCTIALISHASNIMLKILQVRLQQRRQWQPTPVLLPGKSHGRRSLVGCSPWSPYESDTTERLQFHFHALEKEMATHSSILAWRIPETAEPGGLPSMGSHRVRHD